MNRRQPASLVPLEQKPASSRERLRAIGNGNGSGSGADVAGHDFPVLVVDPQTLFRRGLALLVRQWYPRANVADAPDIAAALADSSRRVKPDLVLADALLASRWNFSGLGQLVSRLPSAPVILLADELDAHLAQSAIRAGARGFVAKNAGEDDLRRAIALALSGEIVLPAEQGSERELLGLLPEHAPSVPDTPLKRLTYRQREVLSHLARGRSNKEIARCLGLLESTVKVHVKTILKKLAATNRTQAAMLAFEMGWAQRLDA